MSVASLLSPGVTSTETKSRGHILDETHGLRHTTSTWACSCGNWRRRVRQLPQRVLEQYHVCRVAELASSSTSGPTRFAGARCGCGSSGRSGWMRRAQTGPLLGESAQGLAQVVTEAQGVGCLRARLESLCLRRDAALRALLRPRALRAVDPAPRRPPSTCSELMAQLVTGLLGDGRGSRPCRLHLQLPDARGRSEARRAPPRRPRRDSRRRARAAARDVSPPPTSPRGRVTRPGAICTGFGASRDVRARPRAEPVRPSRRAGDTA